MRVTIPLNARLGVTVMWLLAIGLMAWDTVVADHMSEAGRWSILLAIGATGWTVCQFMKHSRRVMLEVISWERLASERAVAEAAEIADRDNVRAIR